ncbi:hypothetical protein [Mycoplasmopsis arginini]|uniref:hypothetical protein n=1 Tax=Mycoplasmopsis arginini TaxID=2094 RepID=UPI00227C0395|nr:hypothetical protein [Mycoplasmopsis arginini]MCY2902710.1 hypothetical protein [Mycoplasmopsis arginini QMP CG1-2758]MDI3350515.1 hypothetical protein [Mycoplasmopsis arginini]MDI3351107.1 hypothetical protein [Mycoplasmopsis arginini]MDI3352292.1 hypothetical protein [Mycoplasmopsis arginini]
MKKIYKTLLPLGAIASITIVPISALSCAQTEKQLFEAEIKSVQDIIKSTSNGFTASTKVKLSKAVLTAQQALAAAQNDQEIKKAKEAFINEVAAIKLSDGKPDPQPQPNPQPNPQSNPGTSSKEDQVVKALSNIFTIVESQKDTYGQKLLQKQVSLWYDRVGKKLVVTDKGKTPNWKGDKTNLFDIKSTADLNGTQLVNVTKPTYTNKNNQVALSSQLDYDIKVKSQTDAENDTKTVVYEVIIKYKAATFSNTGNHAISKEQNKSVVEITVTVSKSTQIDEGSTSGNTENPDADVQEINAWAETTKNKFKVNTGIDKEAFKKGLKEKSIDLYFSYKTFKVAKVAKGGHPNWKTLQDNDFILVPVNDFEWQPGGKQYQLAHPTNSTYKKGKFTNINTQLDYEVKEESGKFILVLKYKGAQYIKGQAPKIGTQEITWELEIA